MQVLKPYRFLFLFFVAALVVALPGRAQEPDSTLLEEILERDRPKVNPDALEEVLQDDDTTVVDVTCSASPSQLLADDRCMWVEVAEVYVDPNPSDQGTSCPFPSVCGDETQELPDGTATIILSQEIVERYRDTPILRVGFDLLPRSVRQLRLRMSATTLPSRVLQLRVAGPEGEEHIVGPFHGEQTIDLPFRIEQEGEVRVFLQLDREVSRLKGRLHFHKAYLYREFPFPIGSND